MTALSHENVKLRHQRLARGWSHEETVRRVHKCALDLGLPPPSFDVSYIKRYERGVRPNRPIAYLLCATFELPPVELGWPTHYVSWPAPSPRTVHARHEEADTNRRQFAIAALTAAAATAAGSMESGQHQLE